MGSESDVKRLREAEVMHGRVAMMAFVGYIMGEAVTPLTGKSFIMPTEVSGPANSHLALRDDYYPGDIGFDPLGLKPTTPEEFVVEQNRELSNGRLAMIAVAGLCAQELVRPIQILENLGIQREIIG